MSLLGNILWLICGGALSALLYALGGLLCCITIVGIPFGLQAFRLARAALTPFGKVVVPNHEPMGFTTLVFNLIWLLTAGWTLACSHVAHAGACALTVVGIPFAIQHLKLVPMCLMPFSYSLEPPTNA